MRIPKRGEKGFTLIELLIVVAILGVLAAVIIPNVSRFFGAGEEEARKTEKSSVQLAVGMMLSDNKISMVPNPVTDPANATNMMSAFPDPISGTTGYEGDKVTEPGGTAGVDDYDYVADDVEGYLLWGHDITADGLDTPLENYLPRATTDYYYTLDSTGIVHQYPEPGGTEYED